MTFLTESHKSAIFHAINDTITAIGQLHFFHS